jgi:hypothetical protein
MQAAIKRSLLFLLLLAIGLNPFTVYAVSNPAKMINESGDTIVVYYLHTTGRCSTCLKMEKYTDEALKTFFAKELHAGRIEWKVLDVQLPKNNQFIKDYNLYTKSVVVSEMKAGKEIRWKNLDQIWMKANSKYAYMTYIKQEIALFLTDKKP